MTATYSASVHCRASTQQALDFLGDGLALGHWALGCWQTEAVGGGVVRGHSLFDDTPSWDQAANDFEAKKPPPPPTAMPANGPEIDERHRRRRACHCEVPRGDDAPAGALPFVGALILAFARRRR